MFIYRLQNEVLLVMKYEVVENNLIIVPGNSERHFCMKNDQLGDTSKGMPRTADNVSSE
jgi:hypothetical protein